MSDVINHSPVHVLMREMGISDHDIQRRRQIVDIREPDIQRLTVIRDFVVEHVEEYTSVFFEYLSTLEEARPLLTNRALLDRARRLKNQHLISMVQSDYGRDYVAQRLELGLLYSKAGLDLRVFLGAFHHVFRTIGSAIMNQPGSASDGFENFMSLKKFAFLDIGIIVDVLVFERQRLIRQQQDAIRELSTPVLQIRDRLLLLPIIGVIDTHRARLITESLLTAIRGNRAKVVVVDVTGVLTIDSKVANHLIQTVTAARLMGASVIVTGLSADVAQSLVSLGIDLEKLNTVGDLQGGIEEAEYLLGYRVTRRLDTEESPRVPPS